MIWGLYFKKYVKLQHSRSWKDTTQLNCTTHTQSEDKET